MYRNGAVTPHLDPRVNHLLRHIPPHEFELIERHLSVTTLSAGELLLSDEHASQMAYFPLTAIISMMAVMRDGREIEYTSVGREGMVGLHFALDAQPVSGRALCQLGGRVARVSSADLRTLQRTGEHSHLFALLLKYAQSTINVLAQSTACSALHTVRARTARWLLSSQDRVGSSDMRLTHEFLSRMLGVRRAGVSDPAREFQRNGIIRQSRGSIRILDEGLLHAIACECYDVVRAEYDSIFHTVAV